ncbi:MAG: acetamidase/formamidase family protein [Rhizobiaceae bacterium]
MITPEFLNSSIMARRAIAGGKAGREHLLTIADQGDFEFVYGPYSKPRLEIDPGDVVVVDTEDAFGGVITSEDDRPSAKLTFPYLNPQCGPISVRGAEKGDCLAIAIHSVENRGGFGTTCLIPELGALVGTSVTAMLNQPLPEIVRRVKVDKDGTHWSKKLTFPYEPFIGTIGVAPELEAISSLQPDYHGGNMDLPDVRPGAIVYIPVHVPGGRLFVGDCHATQGDGEITGVAIEQPAKVTLQIDVIKGWSFGGPRLETDEFIMAIGSARPLDDATRMALRELIRWMAADYGFDELDAYMILGQVGRMRLGNMVDPKYTMGASILKKYLKGS